LNKTRNNAFSCFVGKSVVFLVVCYGIEKYFYNSIANFLFIIYNKSTKIK